MKPKSTIRRKDYAQQVRLAIMLGIAEDNARRKKIGSYAPKKEPEKPKVCLEA